jgi:fibronectin-binding autotransporter adhesin
MKRTIDARAVIGYAAVAGRGRQESGAKAERIETQGISKSRNRFCRPQRLRTSVSIPALAHVLMAATFFCGAPAAAQAFYWDGGATDGGDPAADPQGGSGTWNTTTTNWDTASTWGAAAAWVNGANDAFFGGLISGAKTVTLGAPITARSLNFSTHNYVLTGNTLTLTAGADITVAAGTAATINSVLAGANGLNKTPTGTLILGGTNTLTGGITVTGGALRLQGTNSANGANNNIYVNTGATLQVNSTDAFGGDTAASRLQMETGSAFEIMSNLTVAHDITLVEAGSLQIIGTGTWNGTVSTPNGDATLRFGAGTLTVNGNLSDNNGFATGLEVIAGGSIVTFNGDLSHTGGLAMRDRAFLAGANTYSGDTIVASGTANIATLTYMNAGAISANSNVVLGDAVSVGLVQFGYSPAGITLGAGGGQFQFAGDGGFVARPAGVDVVLGLNGGAGLTWGAGNFIGAVDTLYLGTNSTGANARELRLTNNIDLGGQQRTVFANFGSIADHGVLSGTLSGAGGGLQVVGNGALELTGANTYTGDTEVQSTLVLGSANAITGGVGPTGGQSNLQLNGAVGAAADYDGMVVLTAASGDFLRDLGAGGDQVQWLADGGFTARGGDRVVNIGNGADLTWGQQYFVGDGRRLSFGGVYGNSTINFENNIDLGAQDRTIEIQDIAVNDFGASLNGVISGAGGLILVGSGDVALTSLNTFTGNAVLGDTSGAGDFLEVTVSTIGDAGEDGNLGAGSLVELRSHGGYFNYVGAGETTNRDWIVGLRNTAHIIFSGNGAGALELAGDITKDATSATNTLVLIDAADSGTNRISGVISESSGTLNLQLNPGTWRLSGQNTYSGFTRLHANTLIVDHLADGGMASSIGDSSSAASNLYWSAQGGILRYVGDGDSTNRLFQVAGGTGSFVESSGTGTLHFTSAGLIELGGGNGAYRLVLGGTNTAENTFAPTLTNLVPSIDHNGQNLGLTKDGAGLWALTTNNNAHANAYTHNTIIKGGALKLNHAGAVTGGLATVSSHGATGSVERSSLIQFDGAAATAGVIGLTSASGGFSRGLTTEADAFIDNNGTVNLQDDDSFVQGVRWSGSGGFAAWDGAQTVNLFGDGRSVTWNTGGFVPTNHNLVFGYETADGTVDFQNAVSLSNAARTIQVHNGTAPVDAIMSGAITSTTTAGALVKNGLGTLALTNDGNAYTGTTTVNAGALQIGNGGATGRLGTGNVSIAGGAALEFNRNNAYSVANLISGAGTLVQEGAGTTTLTAAANAVGATQISAGVLQVDGGLTTPTIAMTGTSGLTVNGTVQATGPAAAILTGDAG